MVDFRVEERRVEEDKRNFDLGYDQAVDEIMSEVRRADRKLYDDLVARYPTWVLRRLRT